MSTNEAWLKELGLKERVLKMFPGFEWWPYPSDTLYFLRGIPGGFSNAVRIKLRVRDEQWELALHPDLRGAEQFKPEDEGYHVVSRRTTLEELQEDWIAIKLELGL